MFLSSLHSFETSIKERFFKKTGNKEIYQLFIRFIGIIVQKQPKSNLTEIERTVPENEQKHNVRVETPLHESISS